MSETLELADAAKAFVAGSLSATELSDAFLGAPVICEARGRPGFVAWGEQGAGVVPVFTSFAAMSAIVGPAGWLIMPGRDVLVRLPEGYGLILDPGQAHALVVPPGTVHIERRPVFVARTDTAPA